MGVRCANYHSSHVQPAPCESVVPNDSAGLARCVCPCRFMSATPHEHDALRNLFRQEMRALQEEGLTFAKEYPEAAALLDPARVEDRDPGVERLGESFGYLTARVREATAMEDAGLEAHLLDLFEEGLDRILPSVLVFQANPGRKLMSQSIWWRSACIFDNTKYGVCSQGATSAMSRDCMKRCQTQAAVAIAHTSRMTVL